MIGFERRKRKIIQGGICSVRELWERFQIGIFEFCDHVVSTWLFPDRVPEKILSERDFPSSTWSDADRIDGDFRVSFDQSG